MGEDILYHAERKVDGKWSVLKDPTGREDFFYLGEGRHKALWDILCGETDPSTGLTFHGFIPIASRRGPPPDYPPRKDYAKFGYSWLLLQELIDYPWEQRLVNLRAFVDAENFRAYLDGALFRYFAVTPPHVDCPIRYPLQEWTIISQEQMLEFLCSGRSSENCFTEIEFTRPYDAWVHAELILSDTIPKLRQYGDPHDIRVVFCFIF